jgi:hypothetical protein
MYVLSAAVRNDAVRLSPLSERKLFQFSSDFDDLMLPKA